MSAVLARATRHKVRETRESLASPHFTFEVPESRKDAFSAPAVGGGFGYHLVVFGYHLEKTTRYFGSRKIT